MVPMTEVTADPTRARRGRGAAGRRPARLRARAPGAGVRWLRDRHHRVRDHGRAAADRRGRGRVHPDRRARHLRLRARRRRRRTGPRVLRRPVAAAGAPDRADGGVRRLQPAERGRADLRGAVRRPLPRRAPARRVLRGRIAGRREPGASRTPRPGGRERHARAERGQRRRGPGRDLARSARRLARVVRRRGAALRPRRGPDRGVRPVVPRPLGRDRPPGGAAVLPQRPGVAGPPGRGDRVRRALRGLLLHRPHGHRGRWPAGLRGPGLRARLRAGHGRGHPARR